MSGNAITEQDTWDHFIGSGALTCPWYAQVDDDWADWKQAGDNHWKITFEDGEDAPDDEETEPERFTLNHAKIMTAVRDLAHKHIDGFEPADPYSHAGPETRRQCAQFMADKEYADFDADTADQVMQVAVFGKVVYS